ncbi:MAG: hypothetical protein IJU53_01815 [Thermoguttaceae bacterium]|nr:hypothetical protein [Thermoguttaceae bacterium]
MKYANFLRLLVILAFLCVFSPASQSGPPQVPGYKPPTHNAPGNPHHFTPPPHAKPVQPQRPAPPPIHGPRPGHPPVVHHGPHHHPGFYPPPPPPPRIPVYLYPPVVISPPVYVPSTIYTEPVSGPYYGEEQADTMKQIGIFKAYVYIDDGTKDAQQNGVAIFYLNDQNLIGGYFYVKQGVQPLTIQGIADKETGDVEFRVNGTNGTYFTKLNDLITRDKVFLTLERENENGKIEAIQVGYLSRVQENL